MRNYILYPLLLTISLPLSIEGKSHSSIPLPLNDSEKTHILQKQKKEPSKKATHITKKVLFIALPLSTLLLYITYTYNSRKKEEEEPSQGDLLQYFKKSSLQSTHTPFTHVEKNDSWLITHLPYTIKEKGADGNCLFYAIIPHIDKTDLQPLPYPWNHDSVAQHWDPQTTTYSEQQKNQAHFLRRLAITFEQTLIDHIKSDEATTLKDPKNIDFINVLYQDILTEKGLTMNKIRDNVLQKNIQEKWLYCKTHFPTYKAKTSQPKNYAGTPEALSIAYALNLDLAIYGNDFGSSTQIKVDQNNPDKPLPCYQKKTGRQKTLTIFQTNGGGHYKTLLKKI